MNEGFIKLWRKTIESEIWKKPPLYFKVWFWLLSNAQYEDYKDLKRGQVWTSIDEIRNGVSYYVGYRKETPTRDVIFDIISWLRNPCEGNDKAMMIATTKATRGLVITICNYDKYQSKKIYEGNAEGNDETGAKPEGRQQDKERSSKEEKENKELKENTKEKFIKEFSNFWSIFPKKIGKAPCIKKWHIIVKTESDANKLIIALQNQIRLKYISTDIKYCPNPLTWLNQERWNDEIVEDRKCNKCGNMTTFYIDDSNECDCGGKYEPYQIKRKSK